MKWLPPLQRVVWAVVLPSALALSACGGGGGDPEEVPAPTASPQSMLVFDAETGPAAAYLSSGLAEVAMILAQFAHDELDDRRRNVADGQVACATGGTRERRLDDVDRSGGPTPGDRLRVTFTNCWVLPFEAVVTGSIEVDVRASSHPGGAAGDLRFKDEWRFTDAAGAEDVTLRGGVRFDGVQTPTGMSMHALGLPDSELMLSVMTDRGTLTERVRGVDVRKALSLTTARYELHMSMTLLSEILSGRVDVTTTEPMAGWMGALPDRGRVAMAGGQGTSATLLAQGVPSGLSTSVRTSGRSSQTTASIDCGSALYGYFFWAQGAVPLQSDLWLARAYPTPATSIPAFGAVRRTPSGTDMDRLPLVPTFEWQFSTPVDALSLPQFVLRRQPADNSPWIRSPDPDWGPAEIPLTARLDGAQLSLTASQQLQPGRSYLLGMLGPEGAANPWTFTLRDTLGRSESFYVSGRTREDMQARITIPTVPVLGSAGQLGLDASVSSDGSSPIVAYAWRQVSGPAAVIENPTSAATAITYVGGYPGAPSSAEFEVTVTNQRGEIDIARTTLETLPIPNASSLLYFRSAPGSWVGSGRVRAVSAPAANISGWTYGNYMFNVSADEQDGTRWGLTFGTLYGSKSLAPGRYSSDATPLNSVDFGGNGAGASWTAWQLDLHEIEWSADGTLTKLAADYFVQSPDSRVYGAVRINSAIPVRP